MILSDKWGQGQLFAFSALDGQSYRSNDFVGTLSGDRIGIQFYTKIKRELAIVGIKTGNLTFEAVTGDYISAKLSNGGHIKIIYADAHLVIGEKNAESYAAVFVEGRHENYTIASARIQDTCDGEYTALAEKDGKFAFTYAKTADEAAKKALDGLELDFEREERKKLEYYGRNQCAELEEYARLYVKCVSAMKTQLYSPEGSIDVIWSTPDRLPHNNMWLWDSVFHAVGHRNTDPKTAEMLILALFANQYDNGMIPHMANEKIRSDITQPPVIAWGAWKVYEESGNREFLRTVFEKNGKFLEWCSSNRKSPVEELYKWYTEDNVTCRCAESGMDNSTRFDGVKNLLAIDFSCFMANEMRFMARIAREIGEDGSAYDDSFLKIKEAVNERLWDSNDRFYYDFNTDSGNIHKVKSVASFLPLFAGICDSRTAEELVSWLKDPETFYTEFPVPSIAKNDGTYGTDMWRGPVWINYNYMIISGLRDYGYLDFAKELTEKTLRFVNEWYEKTGNIFEFYDSENKNTPSALRRKGAAVEPYNFRIKMQSIRDYGWSCALVCDMIRHFGE